MKIRKRSGRKCVATLWPAYFKQEIHIKSVKSIKQSIYNLVWFPNFKNWFYSSTLWFEDKSHADYVQPPAPAHVHHQIDTLISSDIWEMWIVCKKTWSVGKKANPLANKAALRAHTLDILNIILSLHPSSQSSFTVTNLLNLLSFVLIHRPSTATHCSSEVIHVFHLFTRGLNWQWAGTKYWKCHNTFSTMS